MRTIPKNCSMVCWLFALPLTAFDLETPAHAERSHRLVVALMRNYAQVENEVLADARLEAERILRQAGVSINWRDVPAPGEAVDQDQSASEIPQQPALMINLLSPSMAARLHRPANEFGFVTGSIVYVFVDRLDRMRRNGVVFSRSKLLGGILAHEIGHVLLGTGAHAPNGVMRPHWYPDDLLRAEQGTLAFLPQQIHRLRKGRTARSRESVTLTTP